MFGLETKDLEELKNTTKKLNEKTGEIQAEIEAFEKVLNGIRIGVTVILEDELPDGWHIGYAKLGSSWHIIAQRSGESPIKLTSASRLTRLNAIPLFSKLVRELNKKAQGFLRSAEEVLP